MVSAAAVTAEYDEIEQGWTKAYEKLQLAQDDREAFAEFVSNQEKQARTDDSC